MKPMPNRRSYRELSRIPSFEERFEYLSLKALVGERTFGSERWMNQNFYRSAEWKNIRQHVIARDLGRDLGVEGFDIHSRIIIHHMNPITSEEIRHGDPGVLDIDQLITTTHATHNAIHYGDSSLLKTPFVERTPGDTRLWGH